MTLKEEEVQRKEMAKILPSIQIGYVDKNAKKYLNNTIDDIIISESSLDEEKNTNEGVDGDEKMDSDVENKLKTISPNGESNIEAEHADDQKTEAGRNKDSNANKNWTFNFNEDNILASSAGEEANNFLNNLIQRVEEE